MNTHHSNRMRRAAVDAPEAATEPTRACWPASVRRARTAVRRWRTLSLAAAGLVLMAQAGAAEKPRIERVDAPTLRIGEVRVEERNNALAIHGALEKHPLGRVAQRRAGRFPIDGRIHLVALDKQGLVLACRTIDDYQSHAGRGVETFSGTLAASPGQVERIRVIYRTGSAEPVPRDLC